MMHPNSNPKFMYEICQSDIIDIHWCPILLFMFVFFSVMCKKPMCPPILFFFLQTEQRINKIWTHV